MEKEEPVAQSATTSEPVPELKLTPTPTPTPAPTPAATQPAAVEDEEESDWEDLDEVLDDFSASAKPDAHQKDNSADSTSKPLPSSSTDAGPSQPTPPQEASTTTGIDEDAFLKQLEAGMAEMVGSADQEPGMADQWNALEKQLEASGMQPEDLLKQLMGDMLNLGGEEGGAPAAAAAGPSSSSQTQPAATASDPFSITSKAGEEDFQSKIQKTMERMQDSGNRATTAAQGDDDKGVGDDLLAKMLKAMESGVGEGDEPDLMKVFMDMMEDLSHKEMLYEPMKELHTKFGPWLRENREKVSKEELERYELQAGIVGEIVNKFDEPGYSDQNAEDKAYIWERMQKMQDAGNPPDELITNPVTEEVKNQVAGDPGAACPQQ